MSALLGKGNPSARGSCMKCQLNCFLCYCIFKLFVVIISFSAVSSLSSQLYLPETQVWWVKPLTAWVATVLLAKFKTISALKRHLHIIYHVCFSRGNLKSVSHLQRRIILGPKLQLFCMVTIRCWRGRRSEKRNTFTNLAEKKYK